ncbi:MAG TPA: DUF1028 domain-containing protein [Thermoplasmata archaeon]|nr:DUF1028 domain-containing protein [Thermoplasmata archaeon]
MRDPRDHGTFSIVACDRDQGFWGVAVSTKPPSVGAVVPWAAWRVGAVATQAMSNYHFGPRGLELLRRGLSAEDVVRRLTRSDPGRDHRQLAVVDRRGAVAAWTGSKCIEHALHTTGDGYSCQGNMLASATVVPAMASAFEHARGSLASRMMAALRAGAAEGGDKRGMESAALVVVHREPWFESIWSDRWCDVRVDRSARPIAELARLVEADARDTRRFLAQHARAVARARPRTKR